MSRPNSTRIYPALIAMGFALQACLPVIQVIDRPSPPPASTGPVLPPVTALPPADYVALQLVDGSPGLGLWCDIRSDCVEAARILCDNRQSIRADFDIDRQSPGAATYFSLSENAPVRMTVSCPV